MKNNLLQGPPMVFVAYYYGDAYVVRSCSAIESGNAKHNASRKKQKKFEVAPTGKNTTQVLHESIAGKFGSPDVLVCVEPRDELAKIKCHSICNLSCIAVFDTSNAYSIHTGIHEQVATYTAQPWVGYSVNTILGTVFYRKHEHLLHCSGMRRLDHVVAMCGLVRSGSLQSISLFQATIDTSLNKYVQVTHASFLAEVVDALFCGVLTNLPRTEENANMVYLQTDDIRKFLQRAEILGMIDSLGQSTVNDLLASEVQLFNDVRLCLQITRIGHVTHRYIWNDKDPCKIRVADTPTTNTSKTEQLKIVTCALQQMACVITTVLSCMC